MATISVIVPTYRRVESLHRCLKALAEQQLPASETLVIVRDDDTETKGYLEGNGPMVTRPREQGGDPITERLMPPASLPVRPVTVKVGGVVAAMNAGLQASRGEIVALTDDDAAPHWDWLERIHVRFSQDAKVAGVGGRDYVYFGSRLDGSGYETSDVGRLTWYGLVIGNHHLGTGEAHDAALLKGVNCAYRAAALRPIGFDTRLRGEGAQVHWELALGLRLLREGWRLTYDPAIAVDHFPSVRHGKDQRGQFQPDTHYDIVYNETLALAENLSGMRRLTFQIWSSLVGTRFAPGVLQFARLKLLGSGDARADATERFRATWAARRTGRATAAESAKLSPSESAGKGVRTV